MSKNSKPCEKYESFSKDLTNINEIYMGIQFRSEQEIDKFLICVKKLDIQKLLNLSREKARKLHKPIKNNRKQSTKITHT